MQERELTLLKKEILREIDQMRYEGNIKSRVVYWVDRSIEKVKEKVMINTEKVMINARKE